MNSVAICIPTYNQGAYLALAVESALGQTYPHLEVWIGDDASTDETPAIARALEARDGRVRYHQQPRNLGITANNNWLLSQPQTPYIVRLDSDDVLHPRYVETLVAAIEAHPRAAYAHAAVREIGASGELRRVRRLGGRGRYQEPDEALRASASGYRVAANICLFRAQALRELGFYRVAVRYAQDWDLSVRLAQAGWGNVYCDEILADYRVWEDKAQLRPRRKQTELEDAFSIYEESLAPAFAGRGWDEALLQKQRRALALAHAVVLDSPLFGRADRRALQRQLQRLGDSPALRARCFWVRRGFGPVVRWRIGAALAAKDAAKGLLHLARRAR